MTKIIKKRFDSENINWDCDPMFNKLFLSSIRVHLDDWLKIRGYVFLREVYERLGLKITRESCVFGWVNNAEKNEESIGFEYRQIEDGPDFELIFECYPILEYLEEDEGVV